MRAQPAASHWIAGAAFEDADGAPLEVRYPATGEVIARLLRVYQRRLRSNLVHALKPLLPAADAVRVAEATGALIDGVYLREALRGRPTAPGTALAAIEAYIDLELGRAR